jgi:hypothetical protein
MSEDDISQGNQSQGGSTSLLTLILIKTLLEKVMMRSFHRGQSLVIVALLLVLLIGMLALSIDGGNWYWNRRNAQNAADAGALAGASEYCTTRNATQAVTRAQEYTITRNGADAANIVANSGVVTVTASITFTNFFAGVLGYSQGRVSATAAAGCFAPCGGSGVLPIAWSCQPPLGGVTDPYSDCAIEYGPSNTYLIMDSQSLNEDFICQDPITHLPASGLDCDLNNDLVNEVLAGGGRSWLDLDGDGGGGSQLDGWVSGGYLNDLIFPIWVPQQTGVSGHIFDVVYDERYHETMLVPVYNKFCSGDPDPYLNNCPGNWETGDTINRSSSSSAVYFRLVGFSSFYVDCVDSASHGPCPAYEQLKLANPSINPSIKFVEGHFVQGFNPNLIGGTCSGFNVGVYTLNLTR